MLNTYFECYLVLLELNGDDVNICMAPSGVHFSRDRRPTRPVAYDNGHRAGPADQESCLV